MHQQSEKQKKALQKLKSRYRNFLTWIMISAIFFSISLGFLIAGSVVRAKAYAACIGITPASAEDVRLAAYLQAIRLKPGQADAYSLLLDLYNEDGVFSKSESEKFLSLYNANHRQLEKARYINASLQAKVGFLYIAAYDGTSTVKLRMAYPFLQSALDNLPESDRQYLTTKCYYQMANFYQHYIWDAAASMREVDPNVVDALLTEVETTLAAFEKQPENMYARLSFNSAVCDLLLDQRDTLSLSIPQERMESLLNSIYLTLPEPESIQKPQSKELLITLLENEETYRSMIERAYIRKGEK